MEDISKKLNDMGTKIATTSDLKDLTEVFLSVLKEFKKILENKTSEMNGVMSEMKKENASEMEDCMKMMEDMEKEMKDMLKKNKEMSKIEMMAMHDKMMKDMEKIKEMIPDMPDMPNLEAFEKKLNKKIDDIEIPTIDEIEKDLPKLGEPIRDGLELLKGEERLDKSAIKGLERLEKEIEELKKVKGKTVFVGGGNNGGGRITRAYDLTSQLNGILKTFSIPAAWRVISVHSSSAPWSFRETVDYLWTSSSITFTDEINAGTTLAQGQTITIIYSEA